MPSSDSQAFLRELDKKLWTAADRLRSNLDAAVYKHAVLGLIFLKYVSDSFAQRRADVEAMLRDPASDYFIDPADHGGPESAGYAAALRAELEERDYCIEKNVLWVPALTRWQNLQSSAKLPPGSELKEGSGRLARTDKITSLVKLIDDALEAIKKENRAERDRLHRRAARRVRAAARINPKLKGVLDRRYTQLQIDPANLGSLIDLIASIPFQHADLHAKDILGHVYEYFLGQWSGATWTTIGSPQRWRGGANQFALAEGKKGGQPSGARPTRPKASPKGWRGGANQYFTPKSIVSLIVEMIEPYQGHVYDPAKGSGGFFVQSESFIENRAERDRLDDRPARRVSAGARINHGGKLGNLSVYRQESNPTTWRLAAMNMAIRGIDFDFGKEPANSLTQDQHPDLRADYVMANPPFNIKEWWDGKLEGDARWKYGTPPQGNANFAGVQHMLHQLA
jgi:type I restriction enzyme M protein